MEKQIGSILFEFKYCLIGNLGEKLQKLDEIGSILFEFKYCLIGN